jgi:hydroxysqualene synthase
MTTSADVASGKGATDENFPVASHLIAKKHRPAVMAFYDFVRAADDVADNNQLAPQQKLDVLDRMEASLLGKAQSEPVAAPLQAVLAERRLSPQHALDLLAAFRLDCTKNRTSDWADLIHYCSLSAMPVGRYVLDVHGESEATWPASDAVCAALQIINHLQDCGKDFRTLDRVYIPDDVLAGAGVSHDALAAQQASPALRQVVSGLATRTLTLLEQGAVLPQQVKDWRLGLETGVIIALARRLTLGLLDHDPLSQNVHHGKAAFAGIAAWGALQAAAARLRSSPAARPVSAGVP